MNIRRDKFGNLLGYVDICMNLLMAFVLLFAFAFMLIKIQDSTIKKQSAINTNSKLVIHLSWDDASNDDIDIWAKTENPRAIVGYKSKSSKNMFLDNDTLGMSSNALVMKNGQLVASYGNNEHIHIKECTDTHVTINAHYYRSYAMTPVPIKVDLIRLDPLSIIHSASIVLDQPGQEKTVIQFDLDENCNITNITTTQSRFILLKNTPITGQ